jgi:hypothetical protein
VKLGKDMLNDENLIPLIGSSLHYKTKIIGMPKRVGQKRNPLEDVGKFKGVRRR